MTDAASSAVPVDADLPGGGWLAIDEGFSGIADEGGAGAALFDGVGPDFPEEAVVSTAASPHFVRPPRTLVHGLGVEFDSEHAAVVAATILAGADFAACLGRSVAADLASRPVDTELIGIEVTVAGPGHRVRFTGADDRGVRPVLLDVVAVHAGRVVGLLWFGDTPEPFAEDQRDHIVRAVSARLGR